MLPDRNFTTNWLKIYGAHCIIMGGMDEDDTVKKWVIKNSRIFDKF